MRSKDIRQIVGEWDYDPNEVKARIIIGDDGQRKLQMRIELGVIQMELFGRPDGKRPGNYESLLAYQEARLERYRRTHNEESGFALSEEDCLALQQESLQYYHRYLSLFHLNEFEGVVRDTEHNLRLFDLVHEYAEDERHRWGLENYRPYVLRMNTMARCEIAVKEKEFTRALELIEEGIERIEGFFRHHGRSDLIEECRDIHILRERVEQVRSHRPVSWEEELERRMQEAVAAEDYEKAAILRDELKAVREEPEELENR